MCEIRIPRSQKRGLGHLTWPWIAFDFEKFTKNAFFSRFSEILRKVRGKLCGNHDIWPDLPPSLRARSPEHFHRIARPHKPGSGASNEVQVRALAGARAMGSVTKRRVSLRLFLFGFASAGRGDTPLPAHLPPLITASHWLQRQENHLKHLKNFSENTKKTPKLEI